MTPNAAGALDFNPDALHGFALFARLASDERVLLARCMQRRMFCTGETLTKQGSKAVSLYCILSGAVDVIVNFPGAAKTEKVASLGEGHTVGDFALAEVGECTATTLATKETYVVEGNVEAMLALFERQPELGKKVARVHELNKNLFYLL
jgi:CRP-like cAMP-binding protein